MKTIHHLLLAALAWALLSAPAPAHADEAAVRQASEALVAAWNRHDPQAWSAFVAEDVWYAETDDSIYKRFRGRAKILGDLKFSIEGSDLRWDVVRTLTRPDGVVAVVLVQHMSMLPKTDGQYAAVFSSDPSLARWRRDGDGRWRLVFFTSHEGWARAEIRKDEDAAAGIAAPAPVVVAPAVRARTGPGSEPAEYTAFWGSLAQGCNYCHGRPPGLPSSEVASRIVAVGAATADGAGLRAAMQRPALGGTMDRITADPAVTDAVLETLRRYLVDVRDGSVPAQLAFDAPGATRTLEIRNERSSRDAPATIALLRVSGPFVADAARSTCRSGGHIAGQSACTLVLRAAPGVAPGASGALLFRLAPTQGLEPAPRRTTLRIGG
jgi:ketosteroid isomerase-like protein